MKTMKNITTSLTNTLPPTTITTRTTNTYNDDVPNISFGDNDTSRAIEQSYNEIYFTGEWYIVEEGTTKQRKRKHKGQKYKPTTLDRLNQSKQSKFK